MLESGSRRKLRLETGTYEELLAGLAGIAEFDSHNTLVQIFDADLEDFVDLMPGDEVPNKAKVRIVRKKEPAPSTVPGSPVKANIPQSQPLPQILHQVTPLLPVSPQKVFQIAGQGDQLHYSIQPSAVSVAPTVCTVSNVLVQAPFVNVKTSGSNGAITSDSMMTVENVPDATAAQSPQVAVPIQPAVRLSRAPVPIAPAVQSPQVVVPIKPVVQLSRAPVHIAPAVQSPQTAEPVEPAVESEAPAPIAPAEADNAAEPGNTVTRLSRVTEDLRAMLPNHLVTENAKLVPNIMIIPKHEYNGNDYLKFKLPPSFGVLCDIALEKKTVITPRLRRHIINVLFQTCYKITLYPTMRLYRRAIDSLMVKYPHLADGPFNWQCWCLALRSKFKNVRRKLPEAPGLMGESRRKFGGKRTLEEVKYHVAQARKSFVPDVALEFSMSSDSHDESAGDTTADLEGMTFKVEAEQHDSEATSDGSNFNSADLEDVTVSDLLSMCTDEAAAEKLAEQAGGRALRGGKMNKGSNAGKMSLKDRDDMKFELPSFGVFEESLKAKQPVTSRLRRHITTCLFEACSKITLYPTSHLYRTAVDLLLHKYPHLIDTCGETGRELWVDSLKAKFKNVRRRLPASMWSMREVRSKYTTSTRRAAAAAAKPQSEGTGRVIRPPALAGAGDARDGSEVLAVKERNDSIQEMTVQQAIAAFPSYRQESTLLADFKILWNADVAECFEKGIKRLFLVLMNSGTNDEVEDISQAGKDILLMVLGAIARRVRENLDSLLTEGEKLSTPCLVKQSNGNIDLFVNGFYLLTASSLLGGMCVLFASFWVFHIEYPKDARNVLTFLEHAFLNLRHTKPRLKCWELINLYRSTHP